MEKGFEREAQGMKNGIKNECAEKCATLFPTQFQLQFIMINIFMASVPPREPNQKCQTTLSLSLCLSTSIHTFKPALSAFTVKVPELWLELPLGARRTTRSGSKAQQIQWAAIICPFLARTLPPHFSLSPTISLRVWMGPQIRVPVKTKWPTSFHKTEVDNGRGTGNGGDVLSSRFVLLFTAVSAAAGNVF